MYTEAKELYVVFLRRKPHLAIPVVHSNWENALNCKGMATIREYRCEVCGIVTRNPTHWFVIQCGESALTVHRWNAETANAEDARHYCGEAHAQVYISRWFESVCTPPKPTFA